MRSNSRRSFLGLGTPPSKSPQPQETYHYNKLPSDTSFRLVDIYGVNPDGSIKCDLHTVDLEHHPPYEALSYTWGNPFPPEDIEENNEILASSYIQQMNNEKSSGFKQLASNLFGGSKSTNQSGYDTTIPRFVTFDDIRLPITQNLYDALHMLLTPRGVDGKDGRFSKTALHWAAEEGRLDSVRNLLAQGADYHARDCFGETPLHYAAENGHLSVVKILLEAGSDPSILDKSERTPLGCAKQRKRGNVITYMEGQGNQEQAKPFSKPTPEHLMVWIDALCIDQSNVSERTMQVSLMNRIYSEAQRVVVWLGPTDPFIEQAIKDIHNHCRKADRSAEQQTQVLEQLGPKRLLFIGRLFQRAWFERVWILQEFVMAPYVMMYCGPHELLWEDVWRFQKSTPRIIRAFPLQARGWTRFGTPATSSQGIRLLHSLRYDHRKDIDSRLHSLSDLLRLSSVMRSTKPEDKVYAVMGIAQITPALKEFFPAPDYTLSVEEVYRRAALFMLKESRDLDFVLGAPRVPTGGLAESMPSWIPDLAADRSKAAEALPRSNFKAAPDFRIFPDVANDGKSLCVEGRRIDHITYVNELLDKYTYYYLPVILLEWIRFGMMLPPPWTSPSKTRRSTLLLRAVSAGAIQSEVENLDILWLNCIASVIDEDDRYDLPRWISRPPHTYQLRQLALIGPRDATHSLSSAIFKRLNLLGSSPKAREAMEKGLYERTGKDFHFQSDLARVWNSLEALAGPPPGWKLFQSKLSVCAGRRLMISGNGSPALGPASAHPGSEIWLIRGFRAPVVLDPVGNGGSNGKMQYKFRGEAYVHGLMQGEGYNKDGSFDDQFSGIELV